MKPEQIDEVLLVGGQTRAPKVTEIVRRVFGKEPNRALDPDEGVAMGAAIYAGTIQGEVMDLVLLDVAPHTLGIETTDGTLTPLIERNSTIPTRKSRMFTTAADNQARVEVHVLQGESHEVTYCKSLQKFELTDIPPAPRGNPQIEVSFEIDVNGILSVEATDQATGRRQAITIHPSGGLSQADVNRLVDETRKRDSEEKSKKEQEAVARQLDGLVANTMRSVQALEGKLTPDEQQRILDSIERAKKARGDAPRSVREPRLTPDRTHDADGAPLFSRDEIGLLVRLSGLFVTVNRSLGAVGAGLTSEQHDQIESALDRAREALLKGDELQACVDELENARRLLIGLPRLLRWACRSLRNPSRERPPRHEPQAPPAPPARPIPMPGARVEFCAKRPLVGRGGPTVRDAHPEPLGGGALPWLPGDA